VAARELGDLGLEPGAATADGVPFEGGHAEIHRANLWLRSASRVLVRMGSFRARTFAELERHAAGLDWRGFVHTGGGARFRVTARKCRLYHTGAVAERLARVAGVRESDEGGQLFVVRGVRDDWQLSADSSGENLHRRGYRLGGSKAPIRETLAAAALLAAGWDARSPLVDPFCGSGTICIEGALLATGRAPGALRRFAFTDWPSWTEATRMTETARATPHCPEILGYDRDAGAITVARENAARAGVELMTAFSRQALSVLEPAGNDGWLVTNPPYGVRVGEAEALRDLYARFGAVIRERFAGWRVYFFSADAALDRATGLPLEEVLRTSNGGLKVRLMGLRS
jgi:putative N6-adenine-specific DNA methylase